YPGRAPPAPAQAGRYRVGRLPGPSWLLQLGCASCGLPTFALRAARGNGCTFAASSASLLPLTPLWAARVRSIPDRIVSKGVPHVSTDHLPRLPQAHLGRVRRPRGGGAR